jgi:dTDP-4-amino-4,6-dideoxygalactose transaminase
VGGNYPIQRDDLYHKLKDKGIHPRRYFYPLISEFSMYQNIPSSSSTNLPCATETSKQVLCLPIYPDLEIEVIDEICNLIISQ